MNLKGKELEIQTAELMGGSVPRATYKFVAEGPGQIDHGLVRSVLET